VRGIHPPVLADRGLVDAVRALALDSPLTVHVSADLPGRVGAPTETAVYFAITELLTNATKHSGARRVHVLLEAVGPTLRVSVTDDGHGGTDAAHGTGLVGVERRMAALDGQLAVYSPRGGPTVATLEVPAAWPPDAGQRGAPR
jgi:signal transduction histidine kinase